MDRFHGKKSSSRLGELLRGLITTVRQLCVCNLQHHSKWVDDSILENFLETLFTGLQLVERFEEISMISNPVLYCKYSCMIKSLQRDISQILQYQLPAHLLLYAVQILSEIKSFYQVHQLSDSPSNMKQSATQKGAVFRERTDKTTDSKSKESEGSSRNGRSFGFVTGLEKPLWDLKRILAKRDVSVIGIHSMGGSGKTTLALNLCNDEEIKGMFDNNIVFITVSRYPNLKTILESMWDKIIQEKRPQFQNPEDAYIQMQRLICRQNRPVLVILDDVWSRTTLEMLLFQSAHGYKTVVTTRHTQTIPKCPSSRLYRLPLLADSEALNLLCFWAFGETAVPTDFDENVVKKVQSECKGLPLALKVIGSSLQGEPPALWKIVQKRLAKGEPVSDYHKEGLLKRLQTSFDELSDEAKECFLDLAAFPQERRFGADILLNIWVYVRKMKWEDAFSMLLELDRRNLLNLCGNTRMEAIAYGRAPDLYVSVHKAMRDLALYLSSREALIKRNRLVIPVNYSDFLRNDSPEMLQEKSLNARIIAIYADAIENDGTKLSETNFTEAEALVLMFSGNECTLPSFLKSMKNLRVVTVLNNGFTRATLKNSASLMASFDHIKAIHLERLRVPEAEGTLDSLPGLEKLSFSLCQGFDKTTKLMPRLQHLDVEYCTDLETLPSALLEAQSIKSLCITNCHAFSRLPEEVSMLSSLKMLCLSGCLNLKSLPPSIGKLASLELLDISVCMCLEELPEEVGMLCRLKEIDMRECCRLKTLPKSVAEMKNLKNVVCDEEIGYQWLAMKKKIAALAHLNVTVAEMQFSLDWLHL